MTAELLKRRLAEQGITLWAENGALRYSAPKGALTPELRADIVACRAELLALAGDRPVRATTLRPRADRGPSRLSYAQQRLWFIDQLQPGNVAYCVAGGVRLSGPLDIERLRGAVFEIVRRHEVLRAEVRLIDGVPMQIVRDEVALPIDVTDMVDEHPTEADGRERLQALLMKPFDLGTPPLLRVHLIRLDDDTHLLGIALHHIISDGWSVSIFLRELGEIYAGRAVGEGVRALQYADYAVYQHAALTGASLEELSERWRQRLVGAPDLLELPSDRARPADGDWRGHSITTSIDAERVRRLARRHAVTPYMVTLAAFYALLYRYTGQGDLVVGSPVSGRDLPETEAMLGLFANVLPLRCDLSDEPSFETLLERVRTLTLDAIADEALPFDLIVNAVNPPRDARWPPVVQVLFVFQNVPPSTLALPGLEATPIALESGYTRVDLSFGVEERGDEFLLTIEYGVDLFDEWRMRRMLHHYDRILDAAAADPTRSIARLEVVDDAELAQLVAWTASPDPIPDDQTVHGMFETVADRRPDAIALEAAGNAPDRSAPIAFGALDARAAILARELRRRGAGRGTVVALIVERSPEMILGMLAILKAGAAYLPLDPDLPAARRELVLADGKVDIVLARHSHEARLAAPGRQIVLVDKEYASTTDVEAPISVRGDDIAYVMYTSGSTGRPKGVCVTHRNILSLFFGMCRYDRYEDEIFLHAASPSFDASTFEIWCSLLGGARLVVAPSGPLGSWDIADMLRTHRITNVFLTTSLFHLMVNEAPEALAAVPHVWTGGEVLSPVHMRKLMGHRPTGRVLNGYGPTECAVFVTYHEMTCPEDVADPVPIGRPLTTRRAYVVDRHRQRVPIGIAGELLVGGEGVSLGYLNAPELTAERFIDDPFSTLPPGRLYRTGDLVRWRPDGVLDFIGRIDQQIKLRGFRIEPQEIETQLLQHPTIAAASVLMRNDASGGKRLVAYVAAAPGATPEQRVLKRYLSDLLPPYMVPTAFVVMDRLPLTSSGKIDHRALPALASGRAHSADAAPQTAAETTLCAVWSELLKVEPLSVDQNFFELGGDSILSMQVVMRAAARGLRITLRQMLQHQTVAELARAAIPLVDDAGTDTATEAIAVDLSPIQSWFFGLGLPAPAHWNQSVMVALRKPVETARLAHALSALQRRHDALRLRFESGPEGWQARIVPAGEPVPLAVYTRRDATAEACAREQQGLDLQAGPLFRAALLCVESDAPNRLLLVAHHLVVDAVSWRILLDDFARLLAGSEAPRGLSFAAWMKQAAALAQSPALLAEVDRLATPREVAPLPADGPAIGREQDAACFTSTIAPESTQSLLTRANLAYRTRPNEILLSALAEALAAWSGRRSILIDVEGHGRDILPDLDISRTVGWFTTMAPLVIDVPERGGPGDLLLALKTRLQAMPYRGADFGLMRFLGPPAVRERLGALAPAEISFNYLGQVDEWREADSPFAPAEESTGPDKAGVNPRTHAIEIVAAVQDGKLRVDWRFSPERHRETTIAALARRFETALAALLAHCDNTDAAVVAPADFPLAGLDAVTLGHLMTQLPWPASNVTDLLPLSQQQQGMLLDALAAPQSDMNVEQLVLTLACPFDPPALHAAWSDIAGRHPILRTAFLWDGVPRPLQIVLRRVEFSCHVEDLAGLSESQQQDRLSQWLAAERNAGVNMGQAPLMRLAAFDHGRGTWKLVCTFHHILLDGWSMPVLLRDMMAAYRAAHERPNRAWQGDELPYGEYVRWQIAQDIPAAEEFWRANLAGLEAPTLPGRVSPDTASADGYGDIEATLPQAITSALRQAARRNRVTLNTPVQAALAVALAALAGQKDVVFGTTVSGRPTDLAGCAEMLGLFVTSLPLRTQVPAAGDPWTWMRDLHEASEAARGFGYCTTGQIHQWSGLRGSVPLYDVLLVFENYPVGDDGAQTDTWRITDMKAYGSRTRYAVALLVVPGDEMQVRLVHQRGRVPDAAAKRLLDTLMLCLEQVASDQSNMEGLLADCARGGAALLPPAPWDAPPGTGRLAVTPTEHVVARIWAEVLGLDDVFVDHSFFELGGHSLQAMDLTARLGEACGHHVSLALLLSHPTVAGLAKAIDDGMLQPAALVLLAGRTGTRRPIFIFPGASGNPHAYAQLVGRLGGDQPVYGVQYEALREPAAPFVSIETLASRIQREIRAVQPAGGLRLFGHSFGGAVAFAVAALEEQAGTPPDLLAVLDLVAPPGSTAGVSLDDEAALIAEIADAAARFFGRTVTLQTGALRSLDDAGRMAALRDALVAAELLPAGTGVAAVAALLASYRHCIAALDAYGPPRIGVPIDVVQAIDSEITGQDSLGWEALTSGRVAVHRVPGDHISMIVEPHVADLAGLLQTLNERR